MTFIGASVSGGAVAESNSEVQNEEDVSGYYPGSKEAGVSGPTFDCRKTSWPSLGAMICGSGDARSADWDLAGAYWALNFSKFSQARATFRSAHIKWLGELATECGRLALEADASDCVARAYRNRAAVYRSELQGDALVEALSSPEARGQIQEALAGAGHLHGLADGIFGTSTRTAIIDFQRSLGENATGFLTTAQRDRLGISESRESLNADEAENEDISQPESVTGSEKPDVADNQPLEGSVHQSPARDTCRFPDFRVFPPELLSAVADQIRDRGFTQRAAGLLRSQFVNILREKADLTVYRRLSAKLLGESDQQTDPYMSIQSPILREMESATPDDLSACFDQFHQLLAEFEASRTFQVAVNWHAVDARLAMVKPVAFNGKIVGALGVLCRREPDLNNLAAPTPELQAIVLDSSGLILNHNQITASLSEPQVESRIEAQVVSDAAGLSTANIQSLASVLSASHVIVWDQDGNRISTINSNLTVDQLYANQQPTTTEAGGSAALDEFIQSCSRNATSDNSELNSNAAPSSEDLKFQACRPKGDAENITKALGDFALYQRSAESCDANFGGYADVAEEFRKMASDAEMVLRRIGPDGIAKINAAHDRMLQAEAFLKMTTGEGTDRQYGECEALQARLQFLKSAVCQ